MDQQQQQQLLLHLVLVDDYDDGVGDYEAGAAPDSRDLGQPVAVLLGETPGWEKYVEIWQSSLSILGKATGMGISPFIYILKK